MGGVLPFSEKIAWRSCHLLCQREEGLHSASSWSLGHCWGQHQPSPVCSSSSSCNLKTRYHHRSPLAADWSYHTNSDSSSSKFRHFYLCLTRWCLTNSPKDEVSLKGLSSSRAEAWTCSWGQLRIAASASPSSHQGGGPPLTTNQLCA